MLASVNDVTLGGFGEFRRKLVELRTGHQTRRVDFRLLAEARLVAFVAGATRVGGAR